MYLNLNASDDPKPQYTGAIVGLIAFAGIAVLYKYLNRKLLEESGKVDIHKRRKRSFITTIALP
jgi:hypothetical protein